LRAARRRPSADRGSILVEFGITVPILAALILGSISTGLAYNSNNSLNNGARESARFAATLSVEGDLHVWLNAVADAAIGAAAGEADPSVTGQHICVAYVYPDGSAADDRTISLVEDSGSRGVLVGGYCFDDGLPDEERRIQVVLGRTAEVDAMVFHKQVGLEAHSVVRFERADG
jgi:hypothetical protein